MRPGNDDDEEERRLRPPLIMPPCSKPLAPAAPYLPRLGGFVRRSVDRSTGRSVDWCVCGGGGDAEQHVVCESSSVSFERFMVGQCDLIDQSVGPSVGRPIIHGIQAPPAAAQTRQLIDRCHACMDVVVYVFSSVQSARVKRGNVTELRTDSIIEPTRLGATRTSETFFGPVGEGWCSASRERQFDIRPLAAGAV